MTTYNHDFLIFGQQVTQTGLAQITAADSPYTVPSNIFYVLADCTAGPITIVLPTLVLATYYVKKQDATANTVTIQSTLLFDGGASTYILARPNEVVSLTNTTGAPGVLVGSQTTTNDKVDRVMTTKGDLLVYNGAAATRLPRGANGQVLATNSLTSTGLQWVTGGGGGGSGLTVITLQTQDFVVYTATPTTAVTFAWNSSQFGALANPVLTLGIRAAGTITVSLVDTTTSTTLATAAGLTAGFYALSAAIPAGDARLELVAQRTSAVGNPVLFGAALSFS